MFCEEQFAALAESLKGEDTVAPLAGLLTLTPANAGTAAAIEKSAINVREVEKNFLKMVIKPL